MKTHSSVICLSGHECAGIFGAHCLLGLPLRVETLWSPENRPKFGIPIPILRSCGVQYGNISGKYLKHAPGLHQVNHHVFQYWLYIILRDVILISMYQCWTVLTFLWESAHSNSYIMLWNLIGSLIYFFFTSENELGYQDFKVFHIHLILK